MKAGRSIRFGPSGERLGLGDRVVVARKRRRLRQIDAALEIGVSRVTLARIELDHIPSARTRAKVLAWLEVQEAVFAAEDAARAAAAEGRRLERLARARERREAAERLGGERLRRKARLTVRRRAARAIRAAGKVGKWP